MTGAEEDLGSNPQEDLGSNSDVVCSNERVAGVGSFSIRAKDESGIQVIARLREHATSITVRVRNFDPDSRGQCLADAFGRSESQVEASKLETF